MTDSAWSMRRAAAGEVVGGGWFVVRRGNTTGRIVVKSEFPPMEYASEQEAVRAARRLADDFPGNMYCVLQNTYCRVRPQDGVVFHFTDSAVMADTAAGGSGHPPDAGAATGSPQLKPVAAAGGDS